MLIVTYACSFSVLAISIICSCYIQTSDFGLQESQDHVLTPLNSKIKVLTLFSCPCYVVHCAHFCYIKCESGYTDMTFY